LALNMVWRFCKYVTFQTAFLHVMFYGFVSLLLTLKEKDMHTHSKFKNSSRMQTVTLRNIYYILCSIFDTDPNRDVAENS
jgi:hypothetical protein